MIVAWSTDDKGRLSFRFEYEKGDLSQGYKNRKGKQVTPGNNECYFALPAEWSEADTHPDLLAAAAMMIVEPFVGKSMTLQRPVSQDLHNYFKKYFDKSIGPVDPQMSPRSLPGGGVPALAFSGGVDSVAASLIMPAQTIKIFVDRDSSHLTRPTKYNKSAALRAIEIMRKEGHDIHAISTDYEFTMDPVNFAWGVSSAVPLLLLADHHRFDSIAFGMILESAYGIGDSNYREHNHKWKRLFETLSLRYNLVTAGLSEVMTSKIVKQNPIYDDVASSCIRGLPGKPCYNCLKCFRKLMLESKLDGTRPNARRFEAMVHSNEVYRHITQTPIHHENIYAYALSSYRGRSIFLRLLANKVQARSVDNSWMDAWYPKSRDIMYDKYADEQVANIERYAQAMTEEQQAVLEGFALHDLAQSNTASGKRYIADGNRFKRYVDAIRRVHPYVDKVKRRLAK